MDGISVAASVIGLVGAAAKVTEYLNALVTSARTAPKLAHSVLLEVSDVSICLSQLQRLLLGMEMGSRSQERLIMIEQLVVALSNCVSIFSELEEILESLELTSTTPTSKVKVAKWLHRQQSISTLLIRLQASKQSLKLIVTTLNCTSMSEAETALSELKALTIQVLESNQTLAERMANLELEHSAYALSKAPNSMQEVEDRHGKSETTLRMEPVLDHDGISADLSMWAPNNDGEEQDNESIVTVKQVGPITTESSVAVDGFAFEQDLLASRPYARATNRRPCWSATSSAVPTMRWSYLSGISLADVSRVSILSLPLASSELFNGYRYVTSRNHLQASEGDNGLPKQASIDPMRDMRAPIFRTPSSWLFGKLFDRWDPSTEESTDKYTVLSENVVLLGMPFSGKHTILQRLQSLFGHGFDEIDRIQARYAIIQDLMDRSVVAWKNLRLSEMGDSTLEGVEDAYRTLLSFQEKKLPADFRLCRALHRIWAHDSLRHEIQNVRGLALKENINWFFEHLESLFLNARSLSDDFLLRQGSEASFRSHQGQLININGISSELLDAQEELCLPNVSSGRFESADSIIFVVPLSAYCQNQPASTSLNMMRQQMEFFASLTELNEVRGVPIIILLNMTDVLRQLITIRPISDYFEDYTGGANCFQACLFFAEMFAERDQRVESDLRIYGTCAVEESSIRHILFGLKHRLHAAEAAELGYSNLQALTHADEKTIRHYNPRYDMPLYLGTFW